MKTMPACLIAILTFISFLIAKESKATNGANGIHDPSSIIKRNGVYHVWGTGDQIIHLTSTDLINWKVDSTVFARGTWPSWINTYVTGFAGNFWAPECILINGVYYMYYSCSTGQRPSAIGVATSTDLVTWADQGMVVYSDNSTTYGSIDPAVFADASGNYWMAFGSHLTGIWMAQLDPNTGKRLNITLTNVAGAGSASEHEAAYVIREDGYYYLFYNVGRCCALLNSTYYVKMGRSANPTGPYVDKNGVSLMSGGGTTALYSSGRFVGPGHFGLLKENGRNILSMHYYDGTSNGYPRLDIASLQFGNGWPVVTRDIIPTGRYQITNKNSNLAWETSGCTGQVLQPLIQSTPDNTAICQQWDVTSAGDGYYRFKNAKSTSADQVVDIPFCDVNQKLSTYDWLNNDCQKFKIEQHANGSYVFLTSVNADKVIEVPFASTAPNMQLGLWDYNGCTCQQWSINLLNGLKTPVARSAENITALSFTAKWDTVPKATSYKVDVSTSPGFSSTSATIAAWNFTSANTTTTGVAANAGKTVVPVGASSPAYSGTAQATGWNNGNGAKYWEAANISTVGFYSLKVFSKQRSGAGGPGNFKLQYKTSAAGLYVDVPGAIVKVADNYTSGVLNNVSLPAECDNKAAVYLRWLMVTNNNVLDTGVNSVTVAGQSNIDDIVITGYNDAGSSFLPGYAGVTVNDTSLQVTGLSSGATYYVRVRAVQGTVESPNSNVITVTTASGAVDNGIHDPSTIVKEGNRYWMYGTGFTSNGTVVPFTIASSTDLFKWTRGLKSVFPAGTWPSWISAAVPNFAGVFWAPDVIYMNGKYYLYYSASTFGSSTSVIGLATSPTLDQDSPDYLWTDQGMVVSSGSSSNVNAIDPAILKDTDGRVWLTYGSFSAGLGIVELDPVTGLKKAGATTVVIAGGGGSAWEAPYLVKEGNYYYLFANRQYCCGTPTLLNSTYYMVVGRSTSPTGPFIDKNGISLIPSPASSGTVVGTTILTSSGKFIGPGHFGLLRDNGRNIVSMHYYDGTSNGYPRLDLANLTFTEDGWPLISRDLIPTGRYKITNKNSGLVWEASGCSGQRNQLLVQNTPVNAALCQQWDITSTGDGYYRFKNAYAATGVAEQVVDIPFCDVNNKLATYDWLNNDCQKFKLDRLSNGSYIFSSSVNASLVIEAPFALTTPETQLGLSAFNNSAGQQWSIDPFPVPPLAISADTISANSFAAKWNASANATGYTLDVSSTPSFTNASGTTVAGWDFQPGTNAANSGTQENIGKTITTVGGTATPTYNTAGNGGLTAQATGWNSGNGTKYWEINISSLNYYNLKVSSKQRSNSGAPRHFKLQYKIGSAGIYRDVPGGYVTNADNYTSGTLSNIPLPANCDNQASLYLRWLMITNTSVDNNANNTAGTVASTGQSNIDDIQVMGNAGSFLTGYNNLAVTDTAKTVSNLSPNTTYYYRVRNVQGSLTSVNSNVIVVTTTAALPVDFTRIKAYQKNNDIQVDWEIATETDIVRYEVEKSLSGQTFTTAGIVIAKGLNGTANYSWPDVTPATGDNFYRIKAIERSGAVRYSSIVKVNTGRGKGEISIYPNPITGNTINLQFFNQSAGIYKVQLLNSIGQQVYQSMINHQGGSATQALQFNTLPQGVYQLQVTNRDSRNIFKIVV